MKLILSKFDNCYFNIASEEYLMNAFSDQIFYLYTNAPSIIVGCNQNTYAEINHEFVRTQNIQVVRRRSGGGAVYHDHGNLNYGFIFRKNGKDLDGLFREFTEPILSALKELGVNAEFSGRNDLTIDGAKFSGNAQWHSGDKVLIHGTLLFDSDLVMLTKALNASDLKFQDKSIKSVKSRVTNIRPHLAADIGPDEFRHAIVESVTRRFKDCQTYEYDEADVGKIQELADRHYSTQAWIYGSSPEFRFRNAFRYEKGTLEICLNASNGFITEVNFYGDFFGTNSDISALRKAIEGSEYSRDGIAAALGDIAVSDYISGIDKETFLSHFFSE